MPEPEFSMSVIAFREKAGRGQVGSFVQGHLNRHVEGCSLLAMTKPNTRRGISHLGAALKYCRVL